MRIIIAVLTLAVTAASSAEDGFSSSGSTRESSVTAEIGAISAGNPGSGAVGATSVSLPFETGNFYMCSNGTPMTPDSSCIGGDNLSTFGCAEGTTLVPPRWRREAVRVDPLTWGSWSLVRGLMCVADEQVSFDDAVRLAWEQMPIAPHEIQLQPDQDWVFSSLPTIGMVDREPRQISTVLLGRDVLIRALPMSMLWDWGHGQPLTTGELGAPYPNHTISHTYLYFEGDVTVNLTTTWSGQYSLNGGASWFAAPGVATTTSTPVPLTVYNPHTHVLACDDWSC